MNKLWHDARFVPYWFVYLLILGLSGFGAGFLYLGWKQSTVLVSNVTCHVKSSYPGSTTIGVSLNCDGHDVYISSPTNLVYDIVAKHVSIITCNALYEDFSLDGCKYTGMDIGK